MNNDKRHVSNEWHDEAAASKYADEIHGTYLRDETWFDTYAAFLAGRKSMRPYFQENQNEKQARARVTASAISDE